MVLRLLSLCISQFVWRGGRWSYNCCSCVFHNLLAVTVVYLFIYFVWVFRSSVYRLIAPVGRVFANGPGDLGSIPGRVIPKKFKIPLCLTLSNIRYVSRVKWSNPGKGLAPSPPHWFSNYWKGCQLFLNFSFCVFAVKCSYREVYRKSEKNHS